MQADNKDRLSRKPIPPRERLIFPLDVPTFDAAWSYIDLLDDAVSFYKLGFELFLAHDDNYCKVVAELMKRGKKVLADLKLFDVPETVGAAVGQVERCGASFVTVHAHDAMLEAAIGAREKVKILAVTVLTSLDRSDLNDLGFPEAVEVEDLVLSRARRALKLGCDGVISSGLEAPRLRDELGTRFLIVTPGIRPVDNRVVDDDQKRVVTPRDAFLRGADYVVVGRPIRDARDPKEAAEEIQAEIAELFH